MWLTLLGPIDGTPSRLGLELILREAEWFWQVRTRMNDKIHFLYLFTGFLSNHGRSGNVFVGSAISVTHFTQVCAQKAWTDISVLDRPFGSENWRYVQPAMPNALLDNILDRLLVYLHDMMKLLIPGDAPDDQSLELADDQSLDLAGEMMIQNIKVSQTPISSSLGPLNRNIFIRRTKMRINVIMDRVKFVEATATEDKIGSFKSQMLRWKNIKTKVTAPIGSTMVRSPFNFSVACVKSCSIYFRYFVANNRS